MKTKKQTTVRTIIKPIDLQMFLVLYNNLEGFIFVLLLLFQWLCLWDFSDW